MGESGDDAGINREYVQLDYRCLMLIRNPFVRRTKWAVVDP
jgi:hypothetical protein